jgi:RNA polymerase sporulation-specific sigma factor
VQVLQRQMAAAGRAAAEPADEELVRRTWEGDERALVVLLGRYRPLVRARARTYFVQGGDREDVLQEGMIGLYRAVTAFDASRQVPFAGFADLCVTRQIRSAVEGGRRRKHQVLTDAVPLTAAAHEPPAPARGDRDPVEEVVGIESAEELLRFCRTTLSGLELDVLAGFLRGQSYEAIAAALGCGTRSVDNALQRVRRKVSAYLEARDAA